MEQFLTNLKKISRSFEKERVHHFKGQHQCKSIDFWTFFRVEGKVVRKNALRMYLAMHLSFQGNFVTDKYLKMAALEPFSCSVFFCGTH